MIFRGLSTFLPAARRMMSSSASSAARSAMVTGGSSGLGEATARALAAKGYSVAIVDRDSAKGMQVVEELGPSAMFVECCVTDPEQVQDAMQQVVDRYDTLDALFNNAGVVGQQQPIGQYDISEWHRVTDINLNGAFYVLRAGLAQMAKQEKGGAIVNMASTAAYRGFQNMAPYTASKWAIRGLTQEAAVEYGHKNIRVNAVAPTGTATPLVKHFIETADDPRSMEDLMTAMNVLDGIPQPADVADAVVFLLSDQARFITGHCLPIDAGALSRMANSREVNLH